MASTHEQLTIVLNHASAPTFSKLIAERFPQVRAIEAPDTESLERHIGEADVLLSMTIPGRLLDRAKKLRWFQCTSAGIDSLFPIRDQVGHLQITNARGIHGDVIADYVMAAVTMLHWDMRGFLRDQAAKVWKPRPVAPLADKTIGVVGLGTVGKTIVDRAKIAGMTVYGAKRDTSVQVEGVAALYSPQQLTDMFPRCDFVVLALPGTPDSKGLIGAAEIASMRRGAFLVNIARGYVVDEPALIRALQGGAIAGAMLDVFETEPLPGDNPLWTLPNVVVTPHSAGYPENYAMRVFSIFSDNIGRFLEGRPLRNVVNVELGY